MQKHITLAISGASGFRYGWRLLHRLLEDGHRVSLLLSEAAREVARLEEDMNLPGDPAGLRALLPADAAVTVWGPQDWCAPVASGSNAADAMVVCPASMGSVAAIAHGMSDKLMERAADVMLKEGRPLLLVVRETPLSVIHLENMLQLARAGAVILPASPGFYHQPRSVDDLVDFIVARVLARLGLSDAGPRWGPPPGPD